MAYPCPRCGDRYTQRLPLVHASGVWQGSWRNGLRGGTRTSQNALSVMAAPPRRKPTVLLAGALLFFTAALLVLLTFYVAPQKLQAASNSVLAGSIAPSPTLPHRNRRHRHPHADPPAAIPQAPASNAASSRQIELHWQAIVTAALLPGVIVCVMLAVLMSRIRYNFREWPAAIQHWQSCFLCRGCGCIFLPNALANPDHSGGW